MCIRDSTYLDWRRVWDTRKLAIKLISVDVQKYRPMVDRMLQMGDWLKNSRDKGNEALPHERVAKFVGFFAGKVVDTTNTVVDKVMEVPNNYAGRWMVVNVAFGMAFHLMPIAFMFFLTTTYEWNLYTRNNFVDLYFQLIKSSTIVYIIICHFHCSG